MKVLALLTEGQKRLVNLLKPVAKLIVSIAVRTPGIRNIIRKLALAPIAIKTKTFERFVCAIAQRTDFASGLIETNAGIMNSLRIDVPLKKGSLVFGRPDNNVSERATLALVKHLSLNSSSFLDIGAHEGVFALSVSKIMPPERRFPVHLFEPDIELFRRIERNFSRNAINTYLNNVAVGEVSGTAIFYRNPSDDSSGSLTTYFAKFHDVESVSVPVLRLKDYLERYNINRACIKIDVEGAGLAAWAVVGEAFNRIDWLIMEIIEPEVENRVVERIIGDTRWTAYYIRDFELVTFHAGEYNYVAPFYNWLFCRQHPEELSRTLEKTPFRILTPKLIN